MKKYVIVLLNIGYWTIFMLLLFVLFSIISSSGTVENQEDSPKLLDWFRIMASTTIIPAFVCYYLNYFIVFDRYLRRRKIKAFFYRSYCKRSGRRNSRSDCGSCPMVSGRRILLCQNVVYQCAEYHSVTWFCGFVKRDYWFGNAWIYHLV